MRKSRAKVGMQEAKSMFPFFFHSLSSYFKPPGDNESFGFVNIISGILRQQSAIIYGLNFNHVRADTPQKEGKLEHNKQILLFHTQRGGHSKATSKLALQCLVYVNSASIVPTEVSGKPVWAQAEGADDTKAG